MKILSIDTSSNVCSIAILEDLNVIYCTTLETVSSHSQKLMPLIKEAFDTSKLQIKDIDLYTCCIGPGSFTGIRIGIATIKGFIDVFSRTSLGISSLEGLAYNIEEDGLIFSILDAKNDNIYGGLFELKNNTYMQIGDYYSDTIDTVLNSLSSYQNNNIQFVGDAIYTYKNKIEKYFKNSKFATDMQCKQNAVSIAKSGLYKYNKFQNKIGGNDTYPIIQPLYLKKSQAERMLENK